MRRLKACNRNDLADGAMVRIEVEGEPIALYRVGDAYFATSDICTHGASSLSEEGELHGFEIECGWHFGRFDIRTGAALASPCNHPLRVYAVTIEQDHIYVTLEGES